MAELLKIEVGALNIAANPHPAGVYRDILSAVADKEVEVWGSDRAKITPFSVMEDDPNRLYLRVLVWAEIDTEGKWLNKEKNVEATPAEKAEIAAALPENYEPNFRSFYAMFIEDKHRLILEYRNELGQHLAASRAERIFQHLFDRYVPDDGPEVAVTAIPDEDTLERIFAIERLRRLEIVVKKPNAGDDVGEDAVRILRRLERLGAKSQGFELHKSAKKKTLTPDNEYRTLAKFAETNGHVTGEGKDAKGKKVFESTKKHPKSVEAEIPENTASFNGFLRALRFF